MRCDVWCVAVFKCPPHDIETALLSFYGFMQSVDGVKSLHFLIRDRVRDEVVVTFRVLTEKKNKRIIQSKMRFKLGELVPEKFTINPASDDPLDKYVDWDAEDRISKTGDDKFSEFCSLLGKMSELVIHMLKKGYFKSDERIEAAHVMSWTLGLTEYGLMSPNHWEVGYYDRIEDKPCPYLKENFPKTKEP